MLGRLAASLLLITSTIACRTTDRSEAGVLEATPFAPGDAIDLGTYVGANEAVFVKMRSEMQMMGISYASMRQSIDEDTMEMSLPANVHPDELVALRVYTSNAYREINKALRTRDPNTLPHLRYLILAASSGLNKLGAAPCVAKRGTTLPANVVATLREGGPYSDRAFLSTTYAPQIPPDFQGKATFIIEADKCPKIDWLSEFPSEKEVLFPPGTDFVITDLEPNTPTAHGTMTIRMRKAANQ